MVDGDGIWTNDEVRQVLHSTTIDLGDSVKDDSFGYGLLNLKFPETKSGGSTIIEPPTEPGPAGMPLIKVGLRLVLSFYYSN
jgi:hypothetical protein